MTSEKTVKNFPIGSNWILLDPYMKNPTPVKITKHYNEEHLLAEDARGVIYYSHVARLREDMNQKNKPAPVETDLLGDPLPVVKESVEDLLG